MNIATDANGKVLLVGDALPTEFNGATLTIHALTDEQAAAYSKLREDRDHTTFDGSTFTAVGTRSV